MICCFSGCIMGQSLVDYTSRSWWNTPNKRVSLSLRDLCKESRLQVLEFMTWAFGSCRAYKVYVKGMKTV